MLSLISPAKINLFLHIAGKRSDGYHNLASLFQTISLVDLLHFSIHDFDILTCSDPSLPIDHTNLVLKAVNLFRRKTGSLLCFRIHLEKNIPYQSGLGGGSSNAATTLWALNQLSGQLATPQQLALWSAEIGSDIPFFFSNGTAYCTGKGEEVRPLNYFPQRALWIVKPVDGLSTPMVYRYVQLENRIAFDPEKSLQSFNNGNPHYFNDLETAAFTVMPSLKEFKKRLIDSGFHTVLMTGSGSAFFCIGEGVPPLNDDLFCRSANFLYREADKWYTFVE